MLSWLGCKLRAGVRWHPQHLMVLLPSQPALLMPEPGVTPPKPYLKRAPKALWGHHLCFAHVSAPGQTHTLWLLFTGDQR